MKNGYNKLISLMLAVALIFISLFITGVSVSANSATVYTTDIVRLRSSATLDSETNVLATLEKNEKLVLLRNSKNGWAYVSRQDGTTGYCSVDYLNVGNSSLVSFKGMVTDDVNFRKGPSTDYDTYGMLYSGASFNVVDNSSELWVKVTAGGNTGYVYRSYTALSLELKGNDFKPADKPDTPDWFDDSLLADIVGSSDVDEASPLAQKITLSHKNITIEKGKKFALTAFTAGGNSVQGAVSYKSSNASVAKVTDSGIVSGVSLGSAVITATLSGSGKVAECKVTVKQSTTTTSEDLLVLSMTSVSLEVGNSAYLSANLPVSFKSSNTAVVTVSDGIITAKSAGTATVTASTKQQSVACEVEVAETTSGVSIKYPTAIVTTGKTYYNGASSAKEVLWTSSDESVATVTNGFITGKKPGKVVITAKNSLGVKTCVMTVTEAEPVRFAYSSPNTSAVGEKITLCAVTDTTRKAVKFNLKVSGKNITVNAVSKQSDSGTLVWTGTTKISSPGAYSTVAYSKGSDGVWKTCSSGCDDAKFTVFVRTTADLETETAETRYVSDDAIDLIANFEGYSPCVYFDTLANGIPTLGYGKVVYIGESFYNDMTRREARAYLVRTINEGGYASSVNNYLDKLGVCRNQHHFDALVSFVYNLGSYVLTSDSDFKDIFLATANVETETTDENDAYVNDNLVNLRSGAGASYPVLACLLKNTKLKLLSDKPTDNWYYVETEGGTKGYIYADYVTKGEVVDSKELLLSRVNKNDFTGLMCAYHHVGKNCVWGLLYRRIDELDVFYYGEYNRNGSDNVFGYKFTCSSNPSIAVR